MSLLGTMTQRSFVFDLTKMINILLAVAQMEKSRSTILKQTRWRFFLQIKFLQTMTSCLSRVLDGDQEIIKLRMC